MKKNRKDTVRTPESVPITEKDFQRRMTFFLLAILACVAVMASSTFALFHTKVSSAGNTLQSAYYTVQVDDAPTGTYTCNLATNDMYTFTIKASGNATTGYCVIKVGDKEYYTDPIIPKNSLELTIQAAEGTTITFTPVWGNLPEGVTTISSITYSLRNPEYVIVHSQTPHATYEVEPTATLANIAAHYGVSVEDIVTYNGTAELTEDMKLKIPGVDPQVTPYHVPVETEITEPETTAEEPETTTEESETTTEEPEPTTEEPEATTEEPEPTTEEPEPTTQESETTTEEPETTTEESETTTEEPEPTTEEPEPTTEEPETTTEESETTTEEPETTVDSVSGEADSNQ